MMQGAVVPPRWRPAGTMLALAVAASLAGCGGGTAPPQTLQGTVQQATSDGDAWTVCLDRNANLRCDAGEPATQADARGAYALEVAAAVDVSKALLAAQAGAGASQRSLSAPATATHISIFSLLIAQQWQSAAGARLGTAQQPLRDLLALGPQDDLLQTATWRSDATLGTLADTLLQAWQTGQAAQSAAPATVAASAPLGQLLLETTARYLDPDTHRLLPGVSARTLGWEVAQAVQPTACQIATPVLMHIDTDNAAPVTTRTDYVSARLRTEAGAAAWPAVDLRTSIRGRGNFTWTLPKKPYRLKLDQAASLLGMPADRDWALLANHSDKTLLRNALAFCLGRQLGMDYTPASEFVELHLNGQYQGVYQLTEHIKVATQRVDIGSMAATEQDPAGFLLEIDGRLDEDYWFHGASVLNMPYTVKSDTDAAQTARIKTVIDDFEQRLFGPDFADPAAGYAGRVDVEALIDFYLVNELMRNSDVFFSSTFVHRKDFGKLVFGPLWDFDISTGNTDPADSTSPEVWWARNIAYLPRLFEDPHFARQVAARWQFLSSRMPAVQAFVTDSAATLDAAQTRNFAAWGNLNEPLWAESAVAGSYAGEIEFLRHWIEQRTSWLGTQWGAVATAAATP